MSQINTQVVVPGTSWARVSFPFITKTVTVVNEDSTAANVVEVSFDGTAIDARLIPGLLAGRQFSQAVQSVYVRASAGSPVARVSAERD